MARIHSPKQFSAVFGIQPAALTELGVLDPTLNVDTRLFIDPLLLEKSQHQEISAGARKHYRTYFNTIISLLEASQTKGDTYWRNAARLLRFPEISGTCLGYGAGSVRGSGIGSGQRDRLIETASDIVRLGIRDPDLFVAMALFEDGIGADGIGDMTTNVILPDLLQFNERILKELRIPTEEFELLPGQVFRLPRNAFVNTPMPVILVPMDVLRRLPIATDWDSAMSAASKNANIRHRINQQIGAIWRERQTGKAKATLRRFAISSAKNFESVLEMLHDVPALPYDQQSDPEGVVFWRQLVSTIGQDFPLTLGPRTPSTIEEAKAIVENIIKQFRFLIEERGLWDQLYEGRTKKPRPELSAQKLFFAVATSYCEANNLDITPEAETGNGPVDFKFSIGRQLRIIVEIKLSTNSRVVSGFATQTRTYQTSEEAKAAYFLLIDVGGMGLKPKRLFEKRNALVLAGEQHLPQIELINAKPQRSASKR